MNVSDPADPQPEGHAAMSALTLEVGKTYRGKRPRQYGPNKWNDRTIIWLGRDKVQYDGPAVAVGRRYPTVERSAFLAWADREVAP